MLETEKALEGLLLIAYDLLQPKLLQIQNNSALRQ